MIRNYLKVAIRYLLKYKEYTLINILGLAVGITCCLLIMLFVRSEFSYDRFHSKADRIARAWVHEKTEGQDFINTVTPIPMAAALRDNLAGIESACRVYSFSTLVKYADNSYNEQAHLVDDNFFKIFDFEIVQGNSNNPFPSANSVVITEPVAKKYFGNSDPIGKNLELQMGEDKVLFTVSAVAREAPVESSIRLDILVPFANDHYFWSERVRTSAWSQVFTESYVLLKQGQTIPSVEKSIPAMTQKLLGSKYAPGSYLIHLQPLTAIHLDTSLPAGIEPISNPKYAYILSTIGILILLLACINFVTLSIGRSTTRATEVGVRKVLGAERQQLIRQFWGEALLLTVVSIALGLILASLSIGPFNQLTGKNLRLHFDATFISFCFVVVLLIALIAGIYPAVILSGFNPVEVFKGKVKMSSNSGLLRRSLIVGQFIASIGMIICTIFVGQQLNYLQSKDLGYRKEQVVIVPTNQKRDDGMQLGGLYRTALLKQPAVENASVSVFSLIESPWATIGYMDDNKVYREFEFNAIDPNFINTMKIQMVAGRNFSTENPIDNNSSILVNETLVKEYGWKDPIGKKLPGKFPHQIVGVMKDFNVESLHTKIKPLVLSINPVPILQNANDVNFAYAAQPRITIRLKPGNLTNQVNTLKSTWNTIAPNQEFEYNFLDQSIAKQYAQESRTALIVKLASALSIFIACMGLFGLATISVARRTKEIGIRKVLGANASNIAALLSKEFVRLIMIASIIAFPIAGWAMNKWLGDFAYRIHMDWWVYLVAAITALVIALLTVSFQAIKAALSNPVNSLRSE